MAPSGPEGVATLFKAVKDRNVSAVRELLRQGIDPNSRNKQEETPLMVAALYDNLEIFEALQKAGGDLSARNKNGNLTLFRAARCLHGNEAVSLEMAQRVIHTAGIGPDQQKLDTALVQCGAERSPEHLRSLIRLGADPNYRADDGESALLCAVWENRLEAVAALLEGGASPNVTVPRGKALSWLENIPRRYWGRALIDLAGGKRLREIVALLARAGATGSAPRTTEEIAESWGKIERWLQTHAPRWNPLHPGAPEREIVEAQRELNLTIPPDLQACYGRHNGSADFFPGVDVSRYWMPLAEVLQHWKMLGENLDRNEFAGHAVKADIGITPVFWDKGWVPFVSNGGGDYYCMDLAPAEGGDGGQIISFNHENGERWLVAPSLRAWLSDLAYELEAGRLRYVEGNGFMDAEE